MTTSIQPRDEVFPGYVLTERLGSGGYAEVWRARAPGGIEKAIKIVYGCYDDQLAAQEMKAMERIKDVRHPFVLSLERFEVVGGRLAILTELADMSLEQRAQQCRAEGLPGIPRDELLRFLADTAEALDFLAERHSLQHLDIKPANLLISGEHVKVADFGLVKELVTHSQNSMVAGMTPTYSAPEMFDDAPSPYSDQYSLAIVYQEMLTGVLPFPGRTAAQLANQHLQSQPQLAALPEIDRPTVARALSKIPTERFPSCRAFVKSLTHAEHPPTKAHSTTKKTHDKSGDPGRGGSKAPITMMPRTVEVPTPPPVITTKATESQPRSVIETKSDVKVIPKPRPKEVVVDVAAPDVPPGIQTPPTLYIAVGGVGIRILNRFRDLVSSDENKPKQSSCMEVIAMDTDRAELKEACSKQWRNPLTLDDTLLLPLKRPLEYREQGTSRLEWLSHRWLYNIPRSLETRGYRALGRLALVDHVNKTLTAIDQKLAHLVASLGDNKDPAEQKDIRVVLLTGMGGGTGGGMAIDLANAARSRIQAAGHRAQLQGVFVCTCLGNPSASPLSVANSYALLAELQFTSVFGNQGIYNASTNLHRLESRDRPFDLVYCLTTKHASSESSDDPFAAIAKQLALASTDGIRQMLQTCQQAKTPSELKEQGALQLRTLGSAGLPEPMQHRIDRLAGYLVLAFARNWLGEADPNEWARLKDLLESSLANAAHPKWTGSTKTAPIVSKAQVDQWLSTFGAHRSTRFACDVAARILGHLDPQDAPQTELLSLKDPVKFVEFASQALTSVSKHIGGLNGTSLPEEDQTIIEKLAVNSQQVLTKLIDKLEQTPADSSFTVSTTNRIIVTECVAAVRESLSRTTGSAAEAEAALQAKVQLSLERADIDLLQCGYDRRTLVAVPSGSKGNEVIEALKKARPTAAIVSADVAEPVVVCEGSGVSPSSLARGFERVYPEIAEAAGRLFTRIDIDWSAWTL